MHFRLLGTAHGHQNRISLRSHCRLCGCHSDADDQNQSTGHHDGVEVGPTESSNLEDTSTSPDASIPRAKAPDASRPPIEDQLNTDAGHHEDPMDAGTRDRLDDGRIVEEPDTSNSSSDADLTDAQVSEPVERSDIGLLEESEIGGRPAPNVHSWAVKPITTGHRVMNV